MTAPLTRRIVAEEAEGLQDAVRQLSERLSDGGDMLMEAECIDDRDELYPILSDLAITIDGALEAAKSIEAELEELRALALFCSTTEPEKAAAR